ncbi:MAG: MBL fold metallo-hydrolase [Firmicutes bacterium]|nr:MBL fold metallo-hydrolase [Bacillota bacterium]MCL2771160.1 MBL fold metallo-hydrolase [Bacillota bacterium]
MQIKIHRGSHQIGGSIVEIKTERTRIIIDIGEELPSVDKRDREFNIEGVTTGTPNCDAVLVTHYHGDHVGMFEKVLPEVPIYMGEIAKRIFHIVQQTIKKKLDKGNPELIERFKTFAPGKRIKIKDITITPLMIDHSAFDAYALLIEAEGKRILHTGDFRMHGARGSKMPLVFEKYASNIDVLIPEGTMLGRISEKVKTQHELTQEAEELMKQHKNMFVLCSSTNIDSIASFYNAAIKNRKPFIVCDYQSEILKIVTKSSKSSFYDFARQKIYTYKSNLHNMMSKVGFCMMVRVNYRSEQAIKAFPENILIYSQWSGYLDKDRSAFDKRIHNFVEKAKHAGSKVVSLHTSGHAPAEDIKKLCEITKPKIIIPIHVEDPKNFTKLGIKSEIKILNDGEIFEC